MKIKSQRDFWAGLLFLVTGIGFAWGATTYSFGSSASPGPGYFPCGLGILLALLGAVVLFKALTIESEGGDRVGKLAWKPLIIIVGAVALFGLALPRLGLVLVLPMVTIVASLAGEDFHWKDALVNGAVLTIGSWAVLILGLKMVIPLWPSFATG